MACIFYYMPYVCFHVPRGLKNVVKTGAFSAVSKCELRLMRRGRSHGVNVKKEEQNPLQH